MPAAEPRGAALSIADMGRPMSRAQRGALAVLRGYKLMFSPFFAGSCRFVPSCSDYAADAIAHVGVLRGSLLALRRLARCHPLGSSGYDPVDRRPTHS